jgi:drug/metabolite transporter (DMT)-like permease
LTTYQEATQRKAIINPTNMIKPHWLSTESYGLLLMVVSAILYSIAGAFVKLSSAGGLPSTEIVFIRGIFQGGIVFGAMFYTDDPNNLSTNASNKKLIRQPFGPPGVGRTIVLARGILGGAGFLFDYHCMTALPLGDAISLMSLYPIITLLLARVFLGEKIQPLHIAAVTASIVGAICIAQPTFLFKSHVMTKSSTIGYISGILGSICLSCVVTLIRKAGTVGVHTLQLLLSWATFGLIYSIILGFVIAAGGDWIMPPTFRVWCHVFGVCSIGAGAHYLLNYAGRIAPAGLVSVVRSSDIMWAYAWEIIIFHQTPNKWTWLGVLLVLSSLVAIGFQKVQEQRGALAKSFSSATIDSESDDEKDNGEEHHVDVEMQDSTASGATMRSRTRHQAKAAPNGTH